MLFSSMLFLWIFLAAVIAVNFLFSCLPFKTEGRRIAAKNAFLLIASLIFYAWGGIYYLLLMLSSILLNYFGGFLLEVVAKNPRQRKLYLALVIALNLGLLFFFKYFNMLVVIIESCMNTSAGFSGVWNSMIGMEGTGALGLKEVVLPIGISFFTFQAMSYVVDLYRGQARLQKNLVDFALYVSLFPQLIAGPIVRYSDVELQLHGRRESITLFVSGQKRFCYGLGKKVLLSNTFAQVADEIWALDTATIGPSLAWFGVLAYSLQIYYDFSGYSDMAIGLGRMFGFSFKENFNYPYTSCSVQEFWRRWHISLSTWFKEYVYIPLGGNRKGKFRTYYNVFIVFLLTGIWHGANFTFIVWGLFYALLQILERLFLKKLLDKNPIKILNWAYTMLAVMIGWVYFRSEDILQANEYLRQMFSFGAQSDHSVLSYLSMKVILCLIFAIPLVGFLQRPLQGWYEKVRYRIPVMAVDFAIQCILVILAVLLLIGGTYNPFIYFQF